MRHALLRERVADRARLPLVSRTRIADSPSPSPAYASPNRNGAGRSPHRSAIRPVAKAVSASAP